jgi:hypothetical protein
MDEGTDRSQRFGVRQTSLRQTDLRRTGVHQTGLRRTGVHQTGLRRTGLRRTGLRRTGPGGPRRAGALAAGLAATALLAAACGGGSSPAPAADSAYQKLLAYSQCMRAHGEPGFPDPQPNGNLLINGQQDHLNGALMNAANKACQHLMPKSKPLTAAQQRQLTVQALKFVACMRTHGIPYMPDPVVNAQGIRIAIGGPGHSGPAPNSPVLRAAQQACQKLMPGGPP